MKIARMMFVTFYGFDAEPEYRFDPARRWRFDWAWPASKVSLEIQGGIFIQGRHSRGAAMLKEWEKLNRAAELGWRIFYCQPSEVFSTALIEQIKRART